MEINAPKNLYKEIQDSIKKYISDNNIKAVCTGISGGIDSTVNVALLRSVCDELNIPIIGRYIHIESNKPEEKISADLVGNAFCDDYKAVDLTQLYETSLPYFEESLDDKSQSSKIRKGNIKARLRMIYIRSLAHKNKGIMLDNTNKTEWNLGYFTIADNGDISPLFDLWKTQVFKLAKYLYNYYTKQLEETFNFKEPSTTDLTNKANAIAKSLALKPTAGLGITDSDLDELCAESYEQVDAILKEILAWKSFTTNWNLKNFLDDQQMLNIPIEIIKNVATRHFNSEFKRKHLPIKI